MEEIGNKYLYNTKTQKVRTKKVVPIRQIVIRKNGTKVNTIYREKNSIPFDKKKKSYLYKSAFLTMNNHDESKLIKDNINLSHSINEPKTNINNNNKSFNETIVRPVIYQESFLKPIILPVNVKYLGDIENQCSIQPIMKSNFQTIHISNKEIQKENPYIQKFETIEKKDSNKENININAKKNIIRRRVIIQKSFKHKDKIIDKEKENKTINHPLPKEEDNLIIKRLNKINPNKFKLAKRIKFNTLQTKMDKENIPINNSNYNEGRNNIIYKSQKLKNEENILTNNNNNNLRRSMKALEKSNNITINNTLKQTYEEMIKNKKFTVGLKNQISNIHQNGPRDSIRYKNN